MSKKITLYGICITLCILTQCKNKQECNLNDMINKAYMNVSGFGISPEDSKKFEQLGCASTYGEITFQGVDTLLTKLKLTNNDVFYDLGCGVGKMVVQVYLGSPVKKSVGIELCHDRAQKALNIKEQLIKDNKIEKDRTLAFYQESFLDSNLDDATIIYLASTCFPEDLMKKITDKIETLKPGLRIATLKKLAESAKLKLVEEFILPMTWSDSTTAYLYELL